MTHIKINTHSLSLAVTHTDQHTRFPLLFYSKKAVFLKTIYLPIIDVVSWSASFVQSCHMALINDDKSCVKKVCEPVVKLTHSKNNK